MGLETHVSGIAEKLAPQAWLKVKLGRYSSMVTSHCVRK